MGWLSMEIGGEERSVRTSFVIDGPLLTLVHQAQFSESFQHSVYVHFVGKILRVDTDETYGLEERGFVSGCYFRGYAERVGGGGFGDCRPDLVHVGWGAEDHPLGDG